MLRVLWTQMQHTQEFGVMRTRQQVMVQGCTRAQHVHYCGAESRVG